VAAGGGVNIRSSDGVIEVHKSYPDSQLQSWVTFLTSGSSRAPVLGGGVLGLRAVKVVKIQQVL
jgi:hypothetical protein